MNTELTATNNNNYGPVAKVYEKLAELYSWGQVLESKRSQLKYMHPGQEVLYVGAGGGEDVLLAAEKGINVTVIELSQEMLSKIEQKITQANLSERVTLVQGDAFEHRHHTGYDAVVANYFLNVFTEETMHKMLVHLHSLIRPNGLIMIADFAPPKGGVINQSLHKAYHALAVSVFHLVANNPFHEIYDYTHLLAKLELDLVDTEYFSMLGQCAQWYRSLVARKPGL